LTNELTIPAPDDWHGHLRFGDILKAMAVWVARQFKRVVAMGNVPSVDTPERAVEYQQECDAELKPRGTTTIVAPKLTPETTPEQIDLFWLAGFMAMKLYLGITTGSAEGIVGLKRLYACLEVMQARGMMLLIHAESADSSIEFDQRERVCLAEIEQAARDFPRLRIVVEHISCAETVDFIRKMWHEKRLVGATVTLHHFKHNKNDVYGNEVDPHLICKPPIQGFRDQRAIQELVLRERRPNVFHGSDFAPHDIMFKGPNKIRSGVLNLPVLVPEWTRIFREHSDMKSLANFMWGYGADFYGLPRNQEKLVLVRRPWVVPDLIGNCRPYMAGQTIEWDMEGFV
jgi:dihydroorotase